MINGVDLIFIEVNLLPPPPPRCLIAAANKKTVKKIDFNQVSQTKIGTLEEHSLILEH